MKTKHKKFAFLPLIVVMLGSAFVGLWTLRPSLADNYVSNAECAGNDISVSASAPATVTQGATFTVTNVASTSTAPNGITVNKVVSTSTITNATPNSTTATWTGTGTATFTATFPDLSLTASGAVGSQIKLNLTSIDLYINGLTTPITCSIAGGNLVGSTPGQPITIVTTTIQAASTTSPKSSPSNKPGTSPTTPAPDATASSTTSTTNTNDSTNDVAPTKTVTVTVTDKSAKALSNIKVTLDNLPPTYTNSQGVASFADVSTGDHKVYVWTADKPIEKGFTLGVSTEKTYGVAVQVPSQSRRNVVLFATISGITLTVAAGAIVVILKRG